MEQPSAQKFRHTWFEDRRNLREDWPAYDDHLAQVGVSEDGDVLVLVVLMVQSTFLFSLFRRTGIRKQLCTQPSLPILSSANLALCIIWLMSEANRHPNIGMYMYMVLCKRSIMYNFSTSAAPVSDIPG